MPRPGCGPIEAGVVNAYREGTKNIAQLERQLDDGKRAALRELGINIPSKNEGSGYGDGDTGLTSTRLMDRLDLQSLARDPVGTTEKLKELRDIEFAQQALNVMDKKCYDRDYWHHHSIKTMEAGKQEVGIPSQSIAIRNQIEGTRRDLAENGGLKSRNDSIGSISIPLGKLGR